MELPVNSGAGIGERNGATGGSGEGERGEDRMRIVGRKAPGWPQLEKAYEYRADVLRGMGFKSYRSYLRSALWADIRRRVIERCPTCVRCLSRPATQVHHRAYDPATMRGENLDALSPVCRGCHYRAERPWMKSQRSGVARLRSANKSVMREKAQRLFVKQVKAGALASGDGAPRLAPPRG